MLVLGCILTRRYDAGQISLFRHSRLRSLTHDHTNDVNQSVLQVRTRLVIGALTSARLGTLALAAVFRAVYS
jgi:hypothetical protein